MYRAADKLVGLIVCFAILTGTGVSVSAYAEDVMALTTPWFHNGWGGTPEPEWHGLIDLYLAGTSKQRWGSWTAWKRRVSTTWPSCCATGHSF